MRLLVDKVSVSGDVSGSLTLMTKVLSCALHSVHCLPDPSGAMGRRGHGGSPTLSKLKFQFQSEIFFHFSSTRNNSNSSRASFAFFAHFLPRFERQAGSSAQLPC